MDVFFNQYFFFFCSTVFRAIQRNARTWSARTTGRGSQGNRLPRLRWFVVHYWSVTSGWWRSPCNVSKIIFWSPWTKREQINYFYLSVLYWFMMNDVAVFIEIYNCDLIKLINHVHTNTFETNLFWWSYTSCIFMYVKCRNWYTIHDIEMKLTNTAVLW